MSSIICLQLKLLVNNLKPKCFRYRKLTPHFLIVGVDRWISTINSYQLLQGRLSYLCFERNNVLLEQAYIKSSRVYRYIKGWIHIDLDVPKPSFSAEDYFKVVSVHVSYLEAYATSSRWYQMKISDWRWRCHLLLVFVTFLTYPNLPISLTL